MRQACLAKVSNGSEQAGDELSALPGGATFLQQQVAEVLFEAVDRIQDGMGIQIGLESGFLFRSKMPAVAPHQGNQAAVPAADGIQIAPAGEEMMVDEANHMKPIGHDEGVGKVREMLVFHLPATPLPWPRWSRSGKRTRHSYGRNRKPPFPRVNRNVTSHTALASIDSKRRASNITSGEGPDPMTVWQLAKPPRC
jgi:hypothetical protein